MAPERIGGHAGEGGGNRLDIFGLDDRRSLPHNFGQRPSRANYTVSRYGDGYLLEAATAGQAPGSAAVFTRTSQDGDFGPEKKETFTAEIPALTGRSMPEERSCYAFTNQDRLRDWASERFDRPSAER